MSFKLFFLSTFKGLKNTSKVESDYDNLFKDYQDFVAVEQSESLKVFLDLEYFVKSEAFKKQKSDLLALKFKGSPEEKQLIEFKKLDKNSKLKRLYQVEQSSELARFNELQNGELTHKFADLRDYVATQFKADKANFKQNKKKDDQTKFEETEAYQKYSEYQKLKTSADIVFCLKYPKTSEYRNYLKMVNSSERKRYEELKGVVESSEFIERKAYLEDAKKWEKTESFQKEVAFNEMVKQHQFVVYKKYKDSNVLDFFKNWDLVFEDRFDQGKLDTAKWQTVSVAAQKTVGKNISQAGDLQAYTDGKNIQIKDHQLQLVVKKEKTDTLVWSFPIGFNPVAMDYSAGLVTTGESGQFKYGILEAKIKFQPKKQLEDVFYLADMNNETRLNLLECGKVNRLGHAANGFSKYESLAGLQAGQFYIFRMEWEHGKVTWKINNQLIFETNQLIPKVPMTINISSIVLDPVESLPHYFEVDWVRFFQKR